MDSGNARRVFLAGPFKALADKEIGAMRSKSGPGLSL